MSDWIEKIDLNLTGQSFTDEKHTNVGGSAFQLDHDWFWGGADLVIRTASGGGGALLVEGVDYQLSVEDTELTARSGKTVYGKVQIITVGYQTGDLYFSGEYIADSNEAPDINDIYAIINRRLGLNEIINGGFRFWQRGTSFAAIATGAYSGDRWKYLKVGAMVHTITRDAGVPANDFPYSIKVDCTTIDAAIAAGDYCAIAQVIEGYNFKKYVGKYGTLSFWVKAPKTGIYCAAFRNSGTDRSYVAEFEVYAADTWEQKTITVQFNFSGGTWDYTNGSGLIVTWCLAAGTDFQTTKDAWQTGNYLATSNQVNACDNVANDFFLAGVKLELGQKAADFVLPDYSQELARCQRYYEIHDNQGVAVTLYAGAGAEGLGLYFSYLVQKRIESPTITKNGTWFVSNCGQPYVGFKSAKGVVMKADSIAGGLMLFYQDSPDDTITIDAEL